MPAEKLSMKKIRELLRLHYEHGLSYRELSRSLGMGLGSVSHYLKRAKAAQIEWPLPEGLSDEMLCNRLFSKEDIRLPKQPTKDLLDFKKIHEELKRKGVTLLLLWYEYREANPQGYSYSRYCYLYRQYSSRLKPSMRITHHAVATNGVRVN